MANRTISVLFYINTDIVPLGLYRQHLCNSRFTDLLLQWIARFSALFDIVTEIATPQVFYIDSNYVKTLFRNYCYS